MKEPPESTEPPEESVEERRHKFEEARRRINDRYLKESPWMTQGMFEMRNVHEYPRPTDWEEKLSSEERWRLDDIDTEARERRDRALAELDERERSGKPVRGNE